MPDIVKIYLFLCSSQRSYNNIFSEFYVTVHLSQKKSSHFPALSSSLKVVYCDCQPLLSFILTINGVIIQTIKTITHNIKKKKPTWTLPYIALRRWVIKMVEFSPILYSTVTASALNYISIVIWVNVGTDRKDRTLS